ncbi:hypothetical protein [Streptomyces sp. NPDC002104]
MTGRRHRVQPSAPGPRLLTEALGVISRRVLRHTRTSSTTAVCASASGHRSHPGRRGGSAGAAPVPQPRHRGTFTGATDPHARAQEVVALHTAGPGELSSLLDMLGLRPGKP